MGNHSSAPKRLKKVRRRLRVERLDQRRVLAAITGAVFEDVDDSMRREVGEPAAPRRLVYLDSNDNAQLDKGETFVLGQSDGSFQFPNLGDGSYLVRLFNGTQTQTQTLPIEANIDGSTIALSDAIQIEPDAAGILALTGDSVVLGDSQSGDSQGVLVGNQLIKMQTLPDGKLLVVGSDNSSATSWIVDPTDATVTPIVLTENATAWAELALNGSGQGVLLDHATDQSVVHKLDASDPTAGIQVTTDFAGGPITVPADTQVLTSNSATRSVFAWAENDGLQLSLWSNQQANFITSEPINVAGTTGLLSFDDASGLLAIRTAGGGVSVHDADANFASLHSLDDVTGPVAIDGARELLVTVSPVDAMLKLIDLRDGALIADLAIDLSGVGQIASLAVNGDSVVVLGAAGITEVALRKAAAAEVTISDGQDPDPILFGVAMQGSNTAPQFNTLPTLETDEDKPLILAAPGARQGASDAEGDQFVLVQLAQPALGSGQFLIDGQTNFTPKMDFHGTDSVSVLLHDGRNASDPTDLNINVESVPDDPTQIILHIDPIPEDVEVGDVVGIIEIIDADGADGGHTIKIDDIRFEPDGNRIIFVGGDIDFESEDEIWLTVTVTDPETGTTVEDIFANAVKDVNEPITAITPTEAEVLEEQPGKYVTYVEVHDDDINPEHTLTVNDSRFVIDGMNLRLADGVALDFETDPVVIVNVTATDKANGDSFTQAITITVSDIPEQPQNIYLNNQTVMELVDGEIVGEVTLDDRAAESQFEFTVDDSRFEIVAGTLKLKDDQFVRRSNQTEIELTITANDTVQEFASIQQKFLIEVEYNDAPFHNPHNPYDVDHSDSVTSRDALVIINYLNTHGPGPLGQGSRSSFCYDVNADQMVTALDALLVLNEIARASGGGGTVGTEPESEQGQAQPEGELIRPDATSPTADHRQAEGEWIALPLEGDAASPQKLPDSTDNSSPPNFEDPIAIPSEATAEQYAENVDETIRLLTEEE